MSDSKGESKGTLSGDSAPPPLTEVRAKGRPVTKEVATELKKAFSKNIIKASDMSHELQSEAIDLIVSQLDKQRGNYEAAAKQVKEQMDKRFGPTWHCAIGEAFSFDMTHQTRNLLFLYHQGNVAVLLWKC